jgi:putative FmdB family regulatory protein
MPVYEYECSVCHFRFERKEGYHQEPVSTCPKCQGKAHRIFLPTEIRIKDKFKMRD